MFSSIARALKKLKINFSATGNLKNEKPWMVYCTGLGELPDAEIGETFQKTFPLATITVNGFLMKVNDLGPFVLVQKILNIVSKQYPNITVSSTANSTISEGTTSLMQYVWTVTVKADAKD